MLLDQGEIQSSLRDSRYDANANSNSAGTDLNYNFLTFVYEMENIKA
jgi:hypothetical protein